MDRIVLPVYGVDAFAVDNIMEKPVKTSGRAERMSRTARFPTAVNGSNILPLTVHEKYFVYHGIPPLQKKSNTGYWEQIQKEYNILPCSAHIMQWPFQAFDGTISLLVMETCDIKNKK